MPAMKKSADAVECKKCDRCNGTGKAMSRAWIEYYESRVKGVISEEPDCKEFAECHMCFGAAYVLNDSAKALCQHAASEASKAATQAIADDIARAFDNIDKLRKQVSAITSLQNDKLEASLYAKLFKALKEDTCLQ